MKNQTFAIINQFEVPKSSESDFLEFFSTHIKLIDSQPGSIDCRLFKANDDGDVLSYISVVRWQNQEAAKKAGLKIDAASREAGVDVTEFQKKHNIKVINRRFSEIPILSE
ncbi:MAG: hypothetical protein CSA11_01445 [Chloroflexi bacterium]|nr:MAG: hypothetical protein CSA11_01445 [Chloroflexota bacterium]